MSCDIPTWSPKCHTNGKRCTIRSARMNVAGTSCTAHSSIGNRMVFEDVTVLAALAWVGLRLMLNEIVILHENVSSFPVWFLRYFLVDVYWLESTILHPWLHGWAVRRERRYTVMRHRVFSLAEISPLSRFLKHFDRVCKWSWIEFFWMHHVRGKYRSSVTNGEDELNEELKWSCNRKASLTHGHGPDMDFDTSAFWPSLTATEQAYCDGPGGYRDICPEGCWQLNQNPRPSDGAMDQSKGRGIKSASTDLWLHTLIRNCNLQYTEHVQPPRWMCATELLVVQGFPLHPLFDSSRKKTLNNPFLKPLSSFYSDRMPRRSLRDVGAQAGNSMHVNNVGAVVCYPMLCISRIDCTGLCNLWHSLNHRQMSRTGEDDGQRNDKM